MPLFESLNLLYNLLFLGALSTAFSPVFTVSSARTKRRKLEIADSLLNAALLGAPDYSGIFVIFTPALMKLITPVFRR